MDTLSIKQKKILDFLHVFIARNGYPPSIRDIQIDCSISSTSVVDYNLNILEHKGYIRRAPDVSRGIELKDKFSFPESSIFPILGYIAAGEPIPVPQADSWNNPPLGDISVPSDLVKDKEDVYALRVKGTSMIDALIDDNDTVLVQYTFNINDGDMAVVWLEKEMESTLKKVYFKGERVLLQPANSLMKPIYTRPENVRLQGKVVGVIRRL